MRHLSRIIVVSLLAVTPAFAKGDPKKTPATKTAAKAPAAKETKKAPKKSVPVSAEHKKALAELYGGFKFGMTKDEVIAVFSKQLDQRYDEKIKATTDVAAQDKARQEKNAEVRRLQQSFVAFDTTKPSPWDVSIVEGEFAHMTNEAMLERWENQGGKNQRRFFFFYNDRLWKMYISLDVSILPEDKKNFATFENVMTAKYGPGDLDADGGVITWNAGEFDVRAVDKLKTYDALALVIEDPHVKKDVEDVRVAKAPPKQDTNPIIKAVVDPEHKDHPDVKSNGDAVDTVIKAQGGSTPPPKK
jgi:hypothetical protein